MKKFKFVLLAMSIFAGSFCLAANYQEGECHVKHIAPEICKSVRGLFASGIAAEDGKTLHDACTAAKKEARATLISELKELGLEQCGAYIYDGKRCRRIQIK